MSKNSKNLIVPVKKILKTINSCQTDEDIERCKILIDNYLKSAKKNNINNLDDLKDRLNEELLQRQESLYLAKIFNKNSLNQ